MRGGKGLTRRDFIRIAGVGAVASAAVPALSPLQALGSGGALRVGVLVPISRSYPALGENFAAGLKTYQRQTDRHFDLRVHAFDQSSARQIIQSLGKDRRLDLVIALMGANLADRLRPLLEDARFPLVVADVGANVVRPDELNPSVVYHSLNLWRANWAAAAHAVHQYGRKSFVAASFHESGYDALYAAQLGVESAGGAVVQTRITHVQPQSGEMAALLSEIQSTQPDFVFALYNGAQAVEFMNAYQAAGMFRQIPLVASSFALDDPVLAAVGDSLIGVQSGFSWSSTLDHAANARFAAAYQIVSGKRADAFGVLGYEALQLVDQGVHAAGSTRADRLVEAINAVQLESPRGVVSRGADEGVFASPLYLREVRRQGNTWQNTSVALLELAARRSSLSEIRAIRAAQRLAESIFVAVIA